MSEQETVRVVHNESAEKPWEVSLEGVGLLGTVRAVINHPGRHFETQQEAIEIAEKIKELIKADHLEVEGVPTPKAEVIPLVEDETLPFNSEEDSLSEPTSDIYTGTQTQESGILRDSGPDVVTEPETWESDEGLTHPELTSEDEVGEDVSSAVQPTPATSPSISSSSFFGGDDSADQDLSDETQHKVNHPSGGFPPRPIPPTSISGEESQSSN